MIKNRNIINKIIYLLMIIFIFFNMVGISNGISNKEENKKIKSSYYRLNKSKPLYNRLLKYKQNHLYFIEDFSIPFDDNLSERELRIFNNKTKISGGFRSMNVAQDFTNVLSIIKTSIKRKVNPFDSIKKILNNKILFAN